MPQVYWIHDDNPAEQLRRTIEEYNALYTSLGLDPLPMYPVGAAFKEHGWIATDSQVTEFLDAAKNDEKLPGVSFWEHRHSIALGLDQTIADFSWPVEPVTPPPPPVNLEQRVEKLEANVALNNGTLEVHGSRLTALESRASRIEVDVKDLETAVETHLQDHPEPPPDLPDDTKLVQVTDTKTVAWAALKNNRAGKPIIDQNVYNQTKDPALKWANGAHILVYKGHIRADAGALFYRLYAHEYPVHGYDMLYIQERDVEG